MLSSATLQVSPERWCLPRHLSGSRHLSRQTRLKRGFCLVNERRHDRCGWLYVTNEIDAFTREDYRGIEIVRFGCARVARRLSREAFLQLRLAAVPVPGKLILQRPPGVKGRPIEAPYDVEDARTDGVVATGCDEPRLAAAEVSASSEARKRVPSRAPCAPSINTAARPRPSAIPPAATTTTSALRSRTASTTAGTSARVERVAPCPPASVPWATTMSVPISSASTACATVCT